MKNKEYREVSKLFGSILGWIGFIIILWSIRNYPIIIGIFLFFIGYSIVAKQLKE